MRGLAEVLKAGSDWEMRCPEMRCPAYSAIAAQLAGLKVVCGVK